MRLTSENGASIDLRRLGIDQVAETTPVRTGELPLLSEKTPFYTEARGVGARVWELGGHYRAGLSHADAAWDALETQWRTRTKLTLARYIKQGLTVSAVIVADVYITGTPRREWIELIDGVPRTYRWRLRLLEASEEKDG